MDGLYNKIAHCDTFKHSKPKLPKIRSLPKVFQDQINRYPCSHISFAISLFLPNFIIHKFDIFWVIKASHDSTKFDLVEPNFLPNLDGFVGKKHHFFSYILWIIIRFVFISVSFTFSVMYGMIFVTDRINWLKLVPLG